MRSFKVRDGKVLVDGVVYGLTPTDSDIKGKVGRIQSIHIQGKGSFFPYHGTFNDGTIPVTEDNTGLVDETPKKKGKVGKTELVEKSSKAVGIDGKPIKKTPKTK
jgi:hypothetical protein